MESRQTILPGVRAARYKRQETQVKAKRSLNNEQIRKTSERGGQCVLLFSVIWKGLLVSSTGTRFRRGNRFIKNSGKSIPMRRTQPCGGPRPQEQVGLLVSIVTAQGA